MRVTPASINARVIRELQQALASLARQQDRMSSGRRVVRPSDDPGAAAQALVLRGREAAVAQWARNVAEARDRLVAADDALQAVNTTLTRARELAVQGNNATLDPVARQAIAQEVDRLLENLVALANSRSGHGEYLFGGQESTREAYTATRGSDGRITAVVPNPRGLAAPTAAEVAESVAVATGVPGPDVFGAPAEATYAFDILIRLRDSLEDDRTGVSQALALAGDVLAGGTANPAAFLGIDGATDLQIAGPLGSAYVGLTAAGDDTLSTAGNATSAIALAAAINAVAATTGVTATATAATFTVPGGAELFDDIALGPGDFVINGQSVEVVLAAGAGQNAANRDAFIAAVNALSGTTGVVAAASTDGGVTFTAADGRNIAIRTAAGSGDGSVADEILGFAGPLATDTVVGRGGVQLTASAVFTTTEANATDQIAGDGRASGVGVALDDLAAAMDRVLGPHTLVGARLNWIGLVEERLGAESVALAGDRSRLEDLDVAAAVQEYEQTRLFYEAALASSANLIRTSLLDFLR